MSSPSLSLWDGWLPCAAAAKTKGLEAGICAISLLLSLLAVDAWLAGAAQSSACRCCVGAALQSQGLSQSP